MSVFFTDCTHEPFILKTPTNTTATTTLHYRFCLFNSVFRISFTISPFRESHRATESTRLHVEIAKGDDSTVDILLCWFFSRGQEGECFPTASAKMSPVPGNVQIES